MGGLAVLFLLSIYFVITVLVVVKVKGLPYKAVALLVMLLIPTADAIYGRYKLKQMCAAEAGLKVYKVAHNVEGFMADAADGFYIQHFGYQFTEAERTHGKYYRASKQNDQIVIEDNVTPKSVYRLRLIREFEMPNYDKNQSYYRHQEAIESIATGEVLATYTHLAFKGGWAERFLGMFSDAGAGNVAWCSTEPIFNKPYIDPIKLLIISTLKHSGE